MVESFQQSLARGQAGEEKFAAKYPSLVRTDGRNCDFLTAGGRSVELKCDYYLATSTANYFLETLSVVEQDKPGGPFQSMSNGVDIFCYYFVKSDLLFIFETTKLCGRILSLLPKYSITRVMNNGYSTYGVRIERSKFTDLQLSEGVLGV